jgi:RNA polymerase sigma-B factor
MDLTADHERATTLIERNLPLARAIAARYGRTPELREELTQVGALGLVAAAARFDPARRVPFGAYAAVTIEGEIRRYLRDRSTVVRVPRRERARARQDGSAALRAVPLADAERRPSPVAADELDGCERRILLRRGLLALAPPEREAVGLSFVGDLSQREIARRMHISQSQASRLLAAALAKLRHELAEADVA